MSYESELEPDAYGPTDAVARSRVSTAGILLIIVGILNLLGGLYLVFEGAVVLLNPQAVQQAAQQMNPQQAKQMQELGWTPDKIFQGAGIFYVVWGIVAIIAALITLFGGIQMRNLRGYGLAVFGSVLALIPFISPTGCCILGEVAGIWGLVVLMSQDVKSAFR